MQTLASQLSSSFDRGFNFIECTDTQNLVCFSYVAYTLWFDVIDVCLFVSKVSTSLISRNKDNLLGPVVQR